MPTNPDMNADAPNQPDDEMYDDDDCSPPAAEFVDYVPMNDTFWADPVSASSDPPATVKVPACMRDRY